jgi:hypothetical protein
MSASSAAPPSAPASRSACARQASMRARVKAMICPIGIGGIRSKLPAAIAVATLAQIIMLDEGRDPRAARRERRRQVDAGQDDLRHRCSLPPARSAGWASRSHRQPERAARKLGIGMVFQHFSLFEALTVAENIALSLRGTPIATSPPRREVCRGLRPAARSDSPSSATCRSASASASRSSAACCRSRSSSSWTSRPRC